MKFQKIAATLLAVSALTISFLHAEALPASLKIGYQKYGTFPILKAKGDFEKRLAALGVKVEWIQFPAGVPILEALNANSVQLGETGEAPPVFAQEYVAYRRWKNTRPMVDGRRGRDVDPVSETRHIASYHTSGGRRESGDSSRDRPDGRGRSRGGH